MKFSMPLAQFCHACHLAADVADGSLKPELRNLKITFHANATATVESTNLVSRISTSVVGVAADPELASLTTEAALLAKALETIDGEAVECKVSERHLSFAGFNLCVPHKEDLPLGDAVPSDGALTLPVNFSEMLACVLPAAGATDDKWGATSCLCLDVGGPGGIKLACADARHMMLYTASTATLPGKRYQELLVPAKVARQLAGFGRNEPLTEILWGPSKLAVRFGQSVFTTSLAAGRFPPYDSSWPKALVHKALIDREPLRLAVAQAGLVAGLEYTRMECLLKPEALALSISHDGRSFATEVLVRHSEGIDQPLPVSLSQPLVKSFLDAAQSNSVLFSMPASRRMTHWQSGENFHCLFVPMNNTEDKA